MRKYTIYERALLNLCKKARVKSPLDLIDKKIAFCFHSEEIEVKMFAKICRVIISNEDGGGFVSILLSSGVESDNENYGLDYDGNEKETWKYLCYHKDEEIKSYLIESILFKLKWWQF